MKKMTLGLPITAAISTSLPRTRQGPPGQGLALVSRGRSTVLILALLGAGLAGVARGQVVTEFPIPTAASGPQSIVAGPDGNLWFTEEGRESLVNQIGRITPAGAVTEFSIPTAYSFPWGIAAGPDGNLWFTENKEGYTSNIGRITTSGVVTLFPIPASFAGGIAAGPDGNLWFTEDANQIGRITTAGVITGAFPIPTADGGPIFIAAGSDGNLWFTEADANQIARITTAGVVTEFPIPTVRSRPQGIAAGSDGNLWFTEFAANQIGRITPVGVVTEFPTSSQPFGIAAGADGNLWFTEGPSQIGRITTAGVITEFPTTTAPSSPYGIAAGPDGNLWFTENTASQIGQITTGPTTPQPMAVDAHVATGTSSNANGVLEPGETVQVAPSWKNTLTDPQSFTGTASTLSGPPSLTYTINDSTADYGTIGADATGDCHGATGDCYLMTVAGTRPSGHLDATFTENLSSDSVPKVRTLHVGDSFQDVPTSHPFYYFIENLFHNGITHGYGANAYAPDTPVTRAQMAVFLMRGKLGSGEIPPPATGTVFNDVPIGGYADWVEQLAGFQITGGCGGGNYCPDSPVTRAQMAVFLLKAEHGSSYLPPDCASIFLDVVCPSQFANWIEQLSAEGITGGCGAGNYCPNSPSTRGQMAVFLVKTFGLQLYGP